MTKVHWLVLSALIVGILLGCISTPTQAQNDDVSESVYVVGDHTVIAALVTVGLWAIAGIVILYWKTRDE